MLMIICLYSGQIIGNHCLKSIASFANVGSLIISRLVLLFLFYLNFIQNNSINLILNSFVEHRVS